jgi:hypothetical protein
MLFDEINSYLKRCKLEISIFKLLLLYNKNSEDEICYNLILSLTKKIEESICIYNKERNSELYNIIDNDFVTLKDLFDEFKKEVYPLFSVQGLSLLTKLPKTDVEKMYIMLEAFLEEDVVDFKQRLLFQIYKTLMYFPNEEYKNSVKQFLDQNKITTSSMEKVMSSIKQQKKDLKNEGLEKSYIELLALYFHYLFIEVQHV